MDVRQFFLAKKAEADEATAAWKIKREAEREHWAIVLFQRMADGEKPYSVHTVDGETLVRTGDRADSPLLKYEQSSDMDEWFRLEGTCPDCGEQVWSLGAHSAVQLGALFAKFEPAEHPGCPTLPQNEAEMSPLQRKRQHYQDALYALANGYDNVAVTNALLALVDALDDGIYIREA